MLTDKFIQGLKATDQRKKHADGKGLFLFIAASGSKLWRMAYRFNGKAKLLSFGEYPQVTLRAARQRRDEAKALLAEGIDPAERKKAEKRAVEDHSFRAVALEWHSLHTLHCERRYRAFILKALNECFFPCFGDKPMDRLVAADIASALAPFQNSGTLRDGRRLMDICGQICRYAVASGRTERDATMDLPPALRPKTDRHRAAMLDADKVGQIMLNLERHEGYFPVGCALRLVPLLFVRSGELRCAEWREFDLSRRLWIIPARRMLTKHEHIVPLSKQAAKILRDLHDYSGEGLLFPGVHSPDKPIDMSTVTVSLRRRGYGETKLSFDGIRALAAQILHKLGYDRQVISVQLAHQGRSEKRDAFDHRQLLGERKTMMQEWADYLYAARDKAQQEKQFQIRD